MSSNSAFRIRAFVLACSLACAGCAYDKPWAFGISSSLYEGSHLDQHSGPPSSDFDPRLAVVLIALYCAPLALDLALLPITLAHDQLVCR